MNYPDIPPTHYTLSHDPAVPLPLYPVIPPTPILLSCPPVPCYDSPAVPLSNYPAIPELTTLLFHCLIIQLSHY